MAPAPATEGTARSSNETAAPVKQPLSRTQQRRLLHKKKEAKSGVKYMAKRKRERRCLNRKLAAKIPELIQLIRAAIGDTE